MRPQQGLRSLDVPLFSFTVRSLSVYVFYSGREGVAYLLLQELLLALTLYRCECATCLHLGARLHLFIRMLTFSHVCEVNSKGWHDHVSQQNLQPTVLKEQQTQGSVASGNQGPHCIFLS